MAGRTPTFLARGRTQAGSDGKVNANSFDDAVRMTLDDVRDGREILEGRLMVLSRLMVERGDIVGC